jgi:hypothetical protein
VLARAGPQLQQAAEAPGTVEVTLGRTSRGLVVHYVNATGTVPLQRPVPVDAGVTRVWLGEGERCSAARRVIGDTPVAVEQDGREVRFDVGRLESYEAVALDLAPQ